MTARLIRSTDRLLTEYLILCGYGLPDTGKTSLAFTSNKPLLIDFDRLVAKAPNRNQGDVLQLDNWVDFENLDKLIDLSKYETIIIDTAGRAIDLLEKHVKTLAMTNCQGDGNLSQKGWGAVKRLFEDRLEFLKNCGKDIVLLVHLKEDKSGEETLDRFDVDGSSRFEIYKSAMAIFRIVVTGKNDKRYLDFSPHEKSIGKNPGRLVPVPFEDPLVAPRTLANVIQRIKDVMNSTAAAKPAAVETAACYNPAAAEPEPYWTKLETLEDFNQALKRINAAARAGAVLPDDLKREFLSKASASGFKYDKQTDAYVAPAAVAVMPAPKPKLDAATIVTLQMQQKAQDERQRAQTAFLADINPKIVQLRKEPDVLKRSVHQKALALGLRFNQEKNWYELDPDAANNSAAPAARNAQAADQGKPAARAGAGDAPRGLPGVAAAGVAGHVAASQSVWGGD